MTPAGEAIADWLRASAPGTRLWVRGLGSSLAPLLRSGDALEVERCAPEWLGLGDIALGESEEGALIAHLVVDTGPVRTASLRGVRDPPLRILGRAVALERGGLRFRVPPGARWLFWGAHRLVPAARFARRWLKSRLKRGG